MGRKRAYCPYCDVFLVHNSLKSRRDHAIGWKHRCNYQYYYNRYLGKAKSLDEADTNAEDSRPFTANSSLGSISSAGSSLFDSSLPSSSRTFATPTCLGLDKKISLPPTIKQPNFMAAGQFPLKPPSLGAPPSIPNPVFTPPSIKSPSFAGPPTFGIANSPLKPPTLGIPLKPPTLGTPLKPPTLGTPLKPPVLGTQLKPPSLGPPLQPPTLGTPLKPSLGTPLKPPQLGPPTLNSPFKPPNISPSTQHD